MKLFPYSLLRIAGSSYDELENLEVKDAVLNNYFNQKKEFKITKKKIDSTLYNLIGSLDDRDEQNLLLNFKRDIYNDRNIPEETLKKVFKISDDGLKALVQSYFTLSNKILSVKENGEKLFSRELAKSRKEFKKFLKKEPLKKGLLLSSKSLLEGLEGYQSNDSEELNRNGLKAEQGALKYVTRMRTKTSPFSTFTNLSIVKHTSKLNRDKKVFLENRQHKNKVSSHVRLNNLLFQYLKAVMFKNEKIYRHFLLRPNPTIQQEEEVFLFLTNNNNIESFQRIEANALLSLLIEKLSAEKEGITFGRIVELLEEYVDASDEELQNYVTQLIEYGFLEFNLGVSGIDTEWDLKLRSKLEKLEKNDVPLMAELRASLQKLREFAQEYEQANADERSDILSKAFKEFKSIAFELHKAADLPEEERMSHKERRALQRKKNREQKEDEDKESEDEGSDNEEKDSEEEIAFKHKSSTYFNLKAKNIFYEDTTLDLSTKINKDEVENFIKLLNNLLHSLRFSKRLQNEKDKMTHFFKEHYQESDKIDFFSFYEDYYREVKKPEAEEKRKRLEKQKKKKKNDNEDDKKNEKDSKNEIAAIQKRKELNEKWTDLFKQSLEESDIQKETDVINISQKQIEEINNELDLSPDETGRNSMGTFVQFFEDEKGNEDSKLKGVVNGTFGGFGKMISRFLHLFDEDIKKKLNEWNSSLSNGELLLENTDASYFNANLHPPLMPNEIWIPGGHNALSEENQIPVTDLAVKVDQVNDVLELIYKPDEKKAHIFDLGFQGRRGRSQLFQMFSNFTLMEYLFYHPVVNALDKWLIEDKTKDKENSKNNVNNEVVEFPRVEYENTIVLRRKKWSVSKPMLPHRNSDESDWDYFVKVNEWRKKYSIPKEVFVFVMSRYMKGNISKKKRQKLSRDDYKPQYINFSNPLLVSLFEKLVRKVPFAIKIEEMLPGSDHLFKIGEKRYVTEFMVQWYNFE